uniref:Uncharacterized protein n=1 Tax=Arundo donax TaxID=35708 RepID=A0A0A9C0R4_ARUDO
MKDMPASLASVSSCSSPHTSLSICAFSGSTNLTLFDLLGSVCRFISLRADDSANPSSSSSSS